MKKVLLLLAISLFTVHSYAQFQIKGKVISAEDGEGMALVNVRLDKTLYGLLTDGEGGFIFADLPEGEYELVATTIGYEEIRKRILLKADIEIDLKLQQREVLTEAVLITSTRASDNSPTAFTTLNREEIERVNLGQDLPYILQNTPSVIVTSDAGAGIGYTGIRIRGSDATRVNVTLNGIPLNDSESQGTFWVDLPDFASSVENIQIQRGVGTSTNGAGAFGGSINIQTENVQADPFAEVNGSIGSFKTWKTNVEFGSGLLNEKFSVSGRISKIASEGYIDRAYSNLNSFYLSAGYYGKKDMIRFNVFSGKEETYQSWNGVPEDSLHTNRTYNELSYDNEIDDYQQDHYQLHYSRELAQGLHANAALHYTKGHGYFEQFRSQDALAGYGLEDVIIGSDTITNSDLIRRRWLDNDFYGMTWSLQYNRSKKLNAVFGGAWNQYDGDHFGEVIWAEYASNGDIRHRYYDNNGKKNDLNVFVRASYLLTSKLSLFGDMQFRNVNYTFLGFDEQLVNVEQTVNLNFFNPKLGLTYTFGNGKEVYASWSVGNKEPSRNDFVESTPGSRPDPEKLNDLEVGYRHSSNRVNFEANGYYMLYKDQLVLTGELNDVGAYTRQNIDKSFRRGIELSGSAKMADGLWFNAFVTFSENRIKDFVEYIDDYDTGVQIVNEYSDTELAFSPSVIGGFGIRYQPVKGFEVNLNSRGVSKQFLDNTGNSARAINAYYVTDLLLSYTMKPSFMEHLRITLMVNNLFNETYETNGYTYGFKWGGEVSRFNYYYPQAGTNYLLGVSARF